MDDRLVMSLHDDGILLRVSQDDYAALLERPGVRPYEFAERPVPAWLVVEADAIAQDGALTDWVEIGLGRSAKA